MLSGKYRHFYIVESTYVDGETKPIPMEEIRHSRNVFSDWIAKQPHTKTLEIPGLMVMVDNYYLNSIECYTDNRLKCITLNNGGINGLPID